MNPVFRFRHNFVGSFSKKNCKRKMSYQFYYACQKPKLHNLLDDFYWFHCANAENLFYKFVADGGGRKENKL